MAAAQALEPAPARVMPDLGRARLLLACAYDLVSLIIALLGSSLVALLWMLGRTGWGRYDLGAGDAVIALATAVSAGPAWTAWQWLHLRDERATFGRRRTQRLATQPNLAQTSVRDARRGVWLALHPVSLPLWVWLTAVLIATGSSPFIFASSLPFTAAVTTTLLAAISLIALLVRPSFLPLHVWIARASFGGRR
jgi:hypothetical protein